MALGLASLGFTKGGDNMSDFEMLSTVIMILMLVLTAISVFIKK